MIAADLQVMNLNRQAAERHAALSLELPEALQEKERQARAMLQEIEQAKSQLLADKRNARAARIKAVKDAIDNLRSTHEARIEMAVRDADPDALAFAISDAAAAVRSLSPEIDALREDVLTDAERRSFVEVVQHEGVGFTGTVRSQIAVLKAAIALDEENAVKLAKSSSVSVVSDAIRKVAVEPTKENAELLLVLLGEVKRFASTGNGRWYGWVDWKNGRSDNQARFWRGLDLLFAQGGFEGRHKLDILTLIRDPSMGFDS